MALFTVEEYHDRLRRTRQRMAEAELDALLLTDPANINYLSGYDGWSFYVPQALLVPLDGEQPVWIGRQMDAAGARLTAWLDQDHIRWYTDEYVQSAQRHPMDVVAAIVGECGYGGAVIGVEMDAYYFTARALVQLRQGLPAATFRDATLLVNWVRAVKSEAEIGCMRRAAAIVDRAMHDTIAAIAEGVRECDAAATAYAAEIGGTEQFGGDYPAMIPMMPSGRKTSAPHLSWSDEPYHRGDSVVLELAGCYRRYHAPLARTAIIGPPERTLSHLADVVAEGIHVALEAVRPGARCEEVEGAWRTLIARYGFAKESRLGYSTGLNYPPDWGEHTASLRRGDQTELQPNMVFHMIAGMWHQDSGLELSETVRVTDTGHEVLTSVPRQLFVR